MAGTFRSLRVRNFRLFIGGQIVSATGTWMQIVAAAWLVLELTHSGVALGFDTALAFLPILLFGAWGGVFADRFDNRRLQIGTQIAYAIVSAVLWTLVATDVVQVWMVYALSFTGGLVTAVDMPTRQSFYLEMVGRDDLTNAMSLNTATFMATRIVGPAIAGAMVGAFGTAPVFLANAISYLAVVVALALMRTDKMHSRERIPRGKGQIREGIRYVARTPELRGPLLVMGVIFLFTYNFQVLVPLLARRTFHGDAATYGSLLSLMGVGSLAGALLLAGQSARPNPRRLAALGVGLGGCSVLAGIAPTLLVARGVMPLLGAVSIGFAITANSTLQLTSSSAMRGRVMALYTVAFLGSTPIGGFLAGWVGQHVSARFGLVAAGVIAVAAGVGGLASRAVRRPAASAGPAAGVAAVAEVGHASLGGE